MFLRAAMRFAQQVRGYIEEEAPAKRDKLLRTGFPGAGLSSTYHIYVDGSTLRLRSARRVFHLSNEHFECTDVKILWAELRTRSHRTGK